MAKRKYTVSLRVIEANRRKLELARRVDGEIRFRPTPRRAAASRANLIKARAVLRAAALSPYGYPKCENRNSKIETPEPEHSRFEISDLKTENRDAKENGSLKSEISNLKSGHDESPISLQNSPSDPPISNCRIAKPKSEIDKPKWEDSPSYGTRFNRGMYAVSLRRSARLAGETAEAFDRHVRQFLEALEPRSAAERCLAQGMAETVWRRLRLFRAQARWEEARLIARLREAAAPGRSELRIPSSEFPDLLSALSSELLTSPRTLAYDLALDVRVILAPEDGLLAAPEKLNARLERLSRWWVEGRGGKGELFRWMTRPRARDRQLYDRPPEALGNPFLGRQAVESRLEGGAGDADLAPFSAQWRRKRKKGGVGDSGFGMGSRSHRAARAEPGGGEFALDSPEKLRRLVEEALSGIESRNSKFEIRNPKIDGGREPRSGGPPYARSAASVESRISTFDSLVSALWKRLNHFRSLAGREAAEVERLLEAKRAGRMSAELMARLEVLPKGERLAATPEGEAGTLLMELLLLLEGGAKAQTWAELGRLNREVDRALFRSLAARLGPDPRWQELEPRDIENWTKDERQDLRERLEAWLARNDSKFEIQDSRAGTCESESKFEIQDSRAGTCESQSKFKIRDSTAEAHAALKQQVLNWQVAAAEHQMACCDLADCEDEMLKYHLSPAERLYFGAGVSVEWDARYYAGVACGEIREDGAWMMKDERKSSEVNRE